MRQDARTRLGRLLLVLAAVSAASGAAAEAVALVDTGPEMLLVEAWHAFGLLVFAGLFGLVAWRPHRFPGVLELAIGHKALMTGLALASPDAAGATTVAVADGLLTLVLVAAYALLRAHVAWRRGDHPTSDGTSAVASPAAP